MKGIVGQNNDRLAENIPCVDTLNIPTTLISTRGFHCNVWRSTRIVTHNGRKNLIDVVIKRHHEPCPFPEAFLLNKDYRELKSKLGEIVPPATFVFTRIDGTDNVIVIAEAVTPWFNIANPANEEEAIALLRQFPAARRQLRRFVEAAKRWHESENARIIDLYGLDNLVLDINREIKYIDSFRVFFYEDLLYLIDPVDEDLKAKIDISLRRRDYLRYLIGESRIARMPSIFF